MNVKAWLKRWFILEDWADTIQLWVAMLLQLVMLLLFVAMVIEQRWLLAFDSVLVLVLSFMPSIIARQLKVQLPVEFTLFCCVFLFSAFVLGEVRDFYERFWWWDLMLHSISALVMGLLGFLMVYIFHQTQKIKLAPIYIALITYGCAVTVGTLWEIFEYSMDVGFGFHMQENNLHDTMTDLIVDSMGAMLAAWLGYHYVKDGDSRIVDRILRRFLERNPRFRKNTEKWKS